MKSPQAMRQQQVLLVVAGSLLVALTEAQTVLGHPYKSNTRHELTGARGQQCAWYVRRGGPNNLFEPVRLDANVQEGTFQVDLNVLLNEETKGTYRCQCRRNEGEKYKLQKEVYFYSADQRFTRPNEVAVMIGEPLKVSACYLSFFPEAANLSTMTLINEATGKRHIKRLRNFCANYTVNVSQPGSYHFQVATRKYGNILSESFNVTLQVAVLPSDPSTQKPTSAEAEGTIVAITVPIAIVFLTLTLLFGAASFVTRYVVKRRNRNAQNLNPENPAPHEVFVNGNQHNNAGVGNNPVPPLQGNGNDANVPAEVLVNVNQLDNDDDDLPAPALQGNDANVPPEAIVNVNQLDNNDDDLPAPALQGNDANVPPEAIVNVNQLDNDDDDLPAPALQGNDANVPPEAIVNVNQLDNNDDDLPAPALQGNDANVPPEAIVNVNQLDGDDDGDLSVPLLQGNDANVSPEVGVGTNQQGNNDVIVNSTQLDDDDGTGDHALANYVPVPHELPGNGIGDLPSEVVDRHHNEHADCGLRVSIAVSNPLHGRVQFVGNCNVVTNSWCTNEDMLDRTTEESTLTSEEEESRQNPKQPTPEEKEQIPKECTDRNKQCRPVDDIQRKASTRSRGAERIDWPWVQRSFSSPSRTTSETNHSLMTRAGYVQTSRDDSLNVPKPFN